MSAIFLRGQNLDTVERRETRLSVSSLSPTEEEDENEEETFDSSLNDIALGTEKQKNGRTMTIKIGKEIAESPRKSLGAQSVAALLRRKSTQKSRKLSRTRILLSKAETFYESYGLKHFTPVLFLILYSLIGAALFCVIEKPHELEGAALRRSARDRTRERTVAQLEALLMDRRLPPQTKLLTTRDLVLAFEQQIKPEPNSALHWDMWGALFYVGTIYTTIGYGNITCQTTGGRLLTMIYAIFGIPLVLAILNDLGNLFCRYIFQIWKQIEATINYVSKQLQKIQIFARRKKGARSQFQDNVEGAQREHLMGRGSGKKRETSICEEHVKQVPVTFALFVTFSWIFFCASLFLFWEDDWSYFQAFYFFFVSLSTVGLGDVVPTKPRYMVMNFGLVIVGLSLVSMTLSVIQLNIEAFLYRMLKMIQEEYAAAVEAGLAVNKDHIVNRILGRQPWYLRKMAPMVMTHSQKQHMGEIMHCASNRVKVNIGVQCGRFEDTQPKPAQSLNTAPHSLTESFHQTQSANTLYSENESEYDFDQFVPEFLKTDAQIQTDIDPPLTPSPLPAVTVQYEDEDPHDLLRFDGWAAPVAMVEKKDAETQVAMLHVSTAVDSGAGDLSVKPLTFTDDHNIIEGRPMVLKCFQETPVQTDDSYLKLAKKLETLKMNRAKSLAIWVSPVARRPRVIPRSGAEPRPAESTSGTGAKEAVPKIR